MRLLLLFAGVVSLFLILPTEASHWGGSAIDSDGDGFTDAAERHIYNSPSGEPDTNPCGSVHQGWPIDLTTGGVPTSTNKITITDITAFQAPVNRMNTSPGHPNYSVRFDLIPGKGLFAQDINVQDQTAVYSGTTGSPPMTGYTKAYGSAFVCNDRSEGKVRFFQKMESRLENSQSGAFTQTEKDFINAHYDAGSMYPTCSDVGGPNPPCGYDTFYTGIGYIYHDWPRFQYNINVGIPVTTSEILTNLAGSPCYYSGNFGNADWRMMDAGNASFKDKIGDFYEVRLTGSPHYKGIYLDDMNLNMNHVQCGSSPCVSPYTNTTNCPKDPDTGLLMTEEAHEFRVLGFAQYLRQRFPHNPIVHNAQIQNLSDWATNTRVTDLIRASDLQEIEHGCLDSDSSFNDTMLKFSRFHAAGAGVFHWGYDSNDQPISDTLRNYGLACHLLLSNQGDYYGAYEDGFPNNWYSGYDTDLGAALGPFYTPIENGNLRRRDFELGQVEINVPFRTGTITVY